MNHLTPVDAKAYGKVGVLYGGRSAEREVSIMSGNGVLAKTNFGQLIPVERDKMPPNFLGRHIVIGTTIDARKGDGIPHHITPVVDMRDALSPLKGGGRRSNDIESDNEHSGGI